MRFPMGDWCIRSYERRDIQALVKYANNPNVSRNLREAFPYPYTRRDASLWIESALAQDEETHFAIATGQELIGGIGFQLQGDVHRRSAELGYWLGEPFWGRGIATLAVRTMIDYAFTDFDLVRLYAYVFAGNPASERVLEKAGFVCEGTLRQSVLKNDRLLDQKIFALIRAVA